jgi:hypothetical protein
MLALRLLQAERRRWTAAQGEARPSHRRRSITNGAVVVAILFSTSLAVTGPELRRQHRHWVCQGEPSGNMMRAHQSGANGGATSPFALHWPPARAGELAVGLAFATQSFPHRHHRSASACRAGVCAKTYGGRASRGNCSPASAHDSRLSPHMLYSKACSLMPLPPPGTPRQLQVFSSLVPCPGKGGEQRRRVVVLHSATLSPAARIQHTSNTRKWNPVAPLGCALSRRLPPSGRASVFSSQSSTLFIGRSYLCESPLHWLVQRPPFATSSQDVH